MVISSITKYQKWLGGLNVLILLSSLCMIMFGIVLKSTYQMDTMDFVSEYFLIFPWLIIGLGIATFLVSAVAFISVGTESKRLLKTYAVIMGLLCMGLFGKSDFLYDQKLE